MIIGTAGHIDHGKTTLVQALTGVDTDRLPEEKKRGITIELGFAPLELPGIGVAGVVDVPGHEAFVRTMLAGATGIDLALLVIAADEGIMPQTREHLAILTLLAVRGGVVALTKTDLVEDEWLALVTEDVRGVLAGSPLTDAPIVPVSAQTGAGLDALRVALSEAASHLPARDPDDLFRMPVDRSFTVKGTGTVVTGTVWSGSLASDAAIRIMPHGRAARVRGIQSHGAPAARAAPGSRVALSIAGVERDEVPRGSWIISDVEWGATRMLRADVALLEDAAPLGPRTRVRFHLGTQDVGARIVAAGGALAPGAIRGARVLLDEPVLARTGDRFVLRMPSPAATIGGGVIADPSPGVARPRPWAPNMAVEERFDALLAEAGAHGISPRTLAVRLGVSPRAAASLAASQANLVTAADGRLLAAAVVDAAVERARALVADYHRASPLDVGMPLAALRSALAAGASVVDLVVSRLSSAGTLVIEGATASMAGWTPTLAGSDAALSSAVQARLAAAGREPPSVPELAVALGTDPLPVLRFLERIGTVAQVADDRYYLTSELDALVEILRTGMSSGRVYSPAELREITGLSRKYLIPFLEYCDRRGITVRQENGRKKNGT
ncbi:MAG: selenocysteine-specific translation elongation factor [Gemmatimonadaceae bacterium]